ncbi:MAG: hypothetical protein OEZ01_03305 [Candidatus Heimdallarchaeota archaeon]|nr:hypothetical protein [Candidatus Heimdallarchaeota archaeon]MDH5645005.1 hypothetical protein [Candidatus Heimdallarchaeota archaeon]
MKHNPNTEIRGNVKNPSCSFSSEKSSSEGVEEDDGELGGSEGLEDGNSVTVTITVSETKFPYKSYTLMVNI